MLAGMTIDEAEPKYATIVVPAVAKKKQSSTENAEFPVSTEIERFARLAKAEPSVNATLWNYECLQ
jgi:hypothetical protein